MANTARQWFYSTPESRPYYIEERVNHSLWNNRLQNVFMSCTQAAPPVQMEGSLDGMLMRFEFVPGGYFILSMPEERKDVIGTIRQILLGLKPSFTYQDNDGMFVVEWHTDGGDARWREIQGDPSFQGLRRMKVPQ
ncbi:MAG: hypothetical protein OXE95_05905 [Chloroflexi bacterium]|nr:hypothetical protein [Chloroflexota bacterium]MCY4247097.1 hypothetical protein [Chloroflexota bacterium]